MKHTNKQRRLERRIKSYESSMGIRGNDKIKSTLHRPGSLTK